MTPIYFLYVKKKLKMIWFLFISAIISTIRIAEYGSPLVVEVYKRCNPNDEGCDELMIRRNFKTFLRRLMVSEPSVSSTIESVFPEILLHFFTKSKIKPY